MSYILEVGSNRYVGGNMTTTGYGTTAIKACAISFATVAEAVLWMERNGMDCAVVESQSLQCVF